MTVTSVGLAFLTPNPFLLFSPLGQSSDHVAGCPSANLASGGCCPSQPGGSFAEFPQQLSSPLRSDFGRVVPFPILGCICHLGPKRLVSSPCVFKKSLSQPTPSLPSCGFVFCDPPPPPPGSPSPAATKRHLLHGLLGNAACISFMSMKT